MERPGSKHGISENASTPDDPASLLAAVAVDDDAKLTAFGRWQHRSFRAGVRACGNGRKSAF